MIISSHNGLCLRQPGVTNALAACKCHAAGTTDSAVTNHREPEQNQTQFPKKDRAPSSSSTSCSVSTSWRSSKDMISFLCSMPYAHELDRLNSKDFNPTQELQSCVIMCVYSYRFIPLLDAKFTSIGLHMLILQK